MRSIRARLTLALVLGLATILGLGGFLSYETTRRGFELRQVESLRSKAWAVATAIGFEDGQLEVEPQDALASEFSTAENPSYFTIRDADGRVVARSMSLKSNEAMPLAPITAQEEVHDVDLPDGRHGIALTLKATPDNELREEAHGDPKCEALIAAGLFVTVADDDIDLRTILSTLRATLAAVFVASLAASALLVHFALRRGLDPLTRMANDAQAIDVNTLSRRFAAGALPSELGPIRDRLNDLLARLEKSFEREKHFNVAIAHELRTPIAELRTTAEVALRWPDAEEPTRVFGDVLSIAERMQRLVTVLLMLRRVESGQEALVRERVVLRDVVDASVRRHDALSKARAIRVSYAIPSELTLDAHAELVALIVDNWIANAIEYGPKSSEVTIEARTLAAHAGDARFELNISNPAPDLTAADIGHLFEAFWRKDASRTSAAHSGLGLALTRTVALALACEVHATLDARSILRLTLSGPMRFD